ncbi:hypothetical protein [Streptomyces sp. NBC_01314]|uniref:hypothetical protein n=1 Tax=Streptomyces sp. NBC_01314 TaxID=2903821 RepID=UPI003085F662|nr:hypothetical protein OG622_50230 [Streptomyces sp. NBC_01314]
MDLVREVLGLDPETSNTDTVRAALSHITDVPTAQMYRRRGGPRPGSGRKPRQAQAA